jgi:hypothetical protein
MFVGEGVFKRIVSAPLHKNTSGSVFVEEIAALL